METTCNHTSDNKMVSAGTVRCMDCLTFLHDHPDSAPRPGLIEANQMR